MADFVTEVIHILRPILQKYRVQRAILFGSMATGDASRRSDVDLILIMETDKRFIDRYQGILQELTLAIPGKSVDLLIYTPDEIEAIKDRSFIRRILAEGIVIYESTEEPLAG